MHELSICRSLRAIVEHQAAGRTVTGVHLRIGRLRQVVPDTLDFAWDVTTRHSPLADARLVIDHCPVVITCRACDEESPVDGWDLHCPCGSGDVVVVGGDELEVTALDVVAA